MSCVLAYNSQNGKSAFVLRKVIKFCSPHFVHSIAAKIHRFSAAFDIFPSKLSGKTTPGFN